MPPLPDRPVMPLVRRTLWIGVGPVGMRVVAEARRRARERWQLPAGAAFVRLEGSVAAALDPALDRLARPPRLDGHDVARVGPERSAPSAHVSLLHTNGWTSSGDGMPPDVAAIIIASVSPDRRDDHLAAVVRAVRTAVGERLAASTTVTAVLLAPSGRRPRSAAGPHGADGGVAVVDVIEDDLSAADADAVALRDGEAIIDGGRIVLASVTAAGWRFPSRAERIAGAAELVLHLALLGPDRWPDLVADPAADVRTAGLALAVVERHAAWERAARSVALDRIARLLGDDEGLPAALDRSWDVTAADLPAAHALIDALAGPLEVVGVPADDPHAAVQTAVARLAWAAEQGAALNAAAEAWLQHWLEAFDGCVDGAVAGLERNGLGPLACGLDGLREAGAAAQGAAELVVGAAQIAIAEIDAALETQAAVLSRLAPAMATPMRAGCRLRLAALWHRRAAARARAQAVAAAQAVAGLLDAKKNAVLTALAASAEARAAGRAAVHVAAAHAQACALTPALLRAQAVVAEGSHDAHDAHKAHTANAADLADPPTPCFELPLPVTGVTAAVARLIEARRADGVGDADRYALDATAWWRDVPLAEVIARCVLDAARLEVGHVLDEELARLGPDVAPSLDDLVAATELLRAAAVPWLTWDATSLGPHERARLEVRWMLAVAGGEQSALWQAVGHDDWHAVIDNRDPLRVGVIVEVRGLGTAAAARASGHGDARLHDESRHEGTA